MLASTSLFDSFSEFKVGSDDFSDHFPLYCTISLPNINLQDSEPFDANANQNNWARFIKYKILHLWRGANITWSHEEGTAHLFAFKYRLKTCFL